MGRDGEETTSVEVGFHCLTVTLLSVILTEIDRVVINGGGVVQLKISAIVPSV